MSFSVTDWFDVLHAWSIAVYLLPFFFFFTVPLSPPLTSDFHFSQWAFRLYRLMLTSFEDSFTFAMFRQKNNNENNKIDRNEVQGSRMVSFFYKRIWQKICRLSIIDLSSVSWRSLTQQAQAWILLLLVTCPSFTLICICIVLYNWCVCIRREQIDKGEKKWRYLVCNIYILVHDMTNSRHWIQSTDDEFVPIFVEYFNRIIYGGNFFSHSFPSRSFSVSSWKPTFINEYLDVKYVGMGIPIFFSFLTWYLFSLYITFPAFVHSFFYIRSSILCCHFHQDD